MTTEAPSAQMKLQFSNFIYNSNCIEWQYTILNCCCKFPEPAACQSQLSINDELAQSYR